LLQFSYIKSLISDYKHKLVLFLRKNCYEIEPF